MTMRTLAAAFAATLLLTACGGGGSRVESSNEVHTTTTGQELLDLKQALDSGAISQSEYDAQRKKILARD